jgi:hypothetical protein
MARYKPDTAVAVGGTAVELVPRASGRKSLLIQNQGANILYLSGPDVASNSGIMVPGGAARTFADPESDEDWYGISPLGTTVYWEWYD